MRFWKRSYDEIEEPGLREKLAEQEGALEATQRHNSRMLGELRKEMQGKIDGVVAINKGLSSAMLRRVAPKMEQKDLAAYVPNEAILRYGLGIMAKTDKDFGRAPIVAIVGDEVVYRSENFDKRCSLNANGLCNVIRSVTMMDDYNARGEYMISGDSCDLFVSALSSDSDVYLIRMVPLGAERKGFAELGRSAVARVKKAMKQVVTPDMEAGNAYAAE